MMKLSLLRRLLLALVLCLWTATAPAQELMMAPPLPAVVPTVPPDPDTLPQPAEVEWAPLPAAAPPDVSLAPAAVPVPAPEPEVELEPAPDPQPAPFVAGASTGEAMEKGAKEIEVWREASVSPQMPARRGPQFEKSYINGNDPVLVRLQFHPLAAGKTVIVRPDPGATVIPPETEFQIGSTGECVISVALAANYIKSRVNVYCDGIRTTVPMSRAPLAVVIQQEALTEGGE